MFEKLHEPLASRDQFVWRILGSFLLGMLMITLAELIGMFGYHYFEQMTWVDAFCNAAMILASMGPLTPLHTDGGKIFAGFYALFCGLMFIFIIGVIFSPIIHRFLHKLHVEK